MSEITIGTCSNCNGPVTTRSDWMGLLPPTPTCRQCGAVPLNKYGPPIAMEPPSVDVLRKRLHDGMAQAKAGEFSDLTPEDIRKKLDAEERT